MKVCRSSGFSLLELLVVLAVLAILMALLLPSIQRVRESAVRMQCANNFKQLALGIHTYHGDHGELPRISTWWGGAPSHVAWGLWPRVLRYIDAGNVADDIDFSKHVCCDDFISIRRTTLKLLSCPSDRDAGKVHPYRTLPWAPICPTGTSTFDGATGASPYYSIFAHTYVGSYGDGFNAIPADQYGGDGARVAHGCEGCASNTSMAVSVNCPRPTSGYGGGRNYRGMFDYHGRTTNTSTLRLNDVLDGVSNTIMLGHTTILTNGADSDWMSSTGSAHGTSLPFNHILRRCLGTPGLWANNCDGNADVNFESRGFTSYHPNGILVAFGDTSVRFLDENTPSFIRNSMGSRSGEENLDYTPWER